MPSPCPDSWRFEIDDEAALANFGAELALYLKAGDVIALDGPLGAGKTTLARAIIIAMAGEALEVPSPTYTLTQNYPTGRGEIFHFDFYRLKGAEEVVELGFDDAVSSGIVLIEWPERARELLPADHTEIGIRDRGAAPGRTLEIHGHGAWRGRVARMRQARHFLDANGWGDARRAFLEGDASTRRYERLLDGPDRALLMDMSMTRAQNMPADEAAYAATARLALTAAPFVALARTLGDLGLSAPRIFAADTDRGFLVIEDLGDALYGDLIARGVDMDAPYRAACDVLVRLAAERLGPGLAPRDAPAHTVPAFDTEAMLAEVELLVKWYWPAAHGAPAPGEVSEGFMSLWRDVLAGLDPDDRVLALRDYHSPNLIWLEDRAGPEGAAPEAVGVIDFQDAVMAHPAYDLVSLLQDARVDVSPEREQAMLRYYLERRADAGIAADPAAFKSTYAVLGAERATKIIGIFARLARRDGKRRYLAHLPRVWRYLERDLEAPALKPLNDWFCTHFPSGLRTLT